VCFQKPMQPMQPIQPPLPLPAFFNEFVRCGSKLETFSHERDLWRTIPDPIVQGSKRHHHGAWLVDDAGDMFIIFLRHTQPATKGGSFDLRFHCGERRRMARLPVRSVAATVVTIGVKESMTNTQVKYVTC
jgi:hypothetical protein